jgi:hypothetical protein
MIQLCGASLHHNNSSSTYTLYTTNLGRTMRPLSAERDMKDLYVRMSTAGMTLIAC